MTALPFIGQGDVVRRESYNEAVCTMNYGWREFWLQMSGWSTVKSLEYSIRIINRMR